MIKFLKTLDEVDFNVRNSNGESALHLCCGQQPKEELAKFLVLCGASNYVKNALGDTPVTLATRFGHAELAMMLNTAENNYQLSMQGGGAAPMSMMNQTSGQMFGSTAMTSASSNKPPTAYSPYHPPNSRVS